jgi:hypothetical protein
VACCWRDLDTDTATAIVRRSIGACGKVERERIIECGRDVHQITRLEVADAT